MPSDLKAPSSLSVKAENSSRRKVADIAMVHSLLLFLLNSTEAFSEDHPQHDPQGDWLSFLQLLSGTALALQPLVLDTLGTACHVQAKLLCEMLKDFLSPVRQELLHATILSAHPVDPTQAAAALKAIPQLFKMMGFFQSPRLPNFLRLLPMSLAGGPGFSFEGEVEVLSFHSILKPPSDHTRPFQSLQGHEDTSLW